MQISPCQYHYVNPDLRVKTKREAGTGSFVGKTFSKQKKPPNSTCLISAHVTLSLYATSCKTSICSQQTLMERRTCLLFVVFSSLAFIVTISNVLYMSWSNSSIIYIRGPNFLTDFMTKRKNASKVESIQALNLERQATIRDFCRRKNRIDEPINIKKLDNIMVDEKLKILFCYIPKVSCTQWKTVLMQLNPPEHKYYVHSARNFKFLHVYPKDEVERMLRTYFKFVFVREPFERLLSAYLDKFHSGDSAFHSNYGRNIIKRYRPGGNPDHRNVTFDEFLNFVINIGNGYWNEHWQTYDKLCHPCGIQYDFIGRFENLQEEANFVLSGIKRSSSISFPHVQPSSTSSKLPFYYSQIPRERLDKVLQIFRGDSEMFGYDLPKSVHGS